MRVRRLAAQAFRGFPSRVDVVTNADVVLLCGENGTGKTSIAEAFEWALFGTVVRKERAKSRGEYQGWAWLRSVHAQSDVPTFAEVELEDGNGQCHVIRRELDGARTRLIVDGRQAVDVRELGIPTEPAFRPFLGQCEIQALIDSEQQDRWEQLSAILGFGAFGSVRTRLQRLRTDTDRDPRVATLRDRSVRVLSGLVRPGEDPLGVDPENLRQRAARLMSLSDTAQWEAIGSAAQTELQELYRRNPRPVALESLVYQRRDLDSAVGSLRQLVDVVVQEAALHRQWQRENRRAIFVAQGLGLVDSDYPALCPFCGERTLTPTKRELLASEAVAPGSPPLDHRDEIRRLVRDHLVGPGPVNVDVLPSIVDALPPEQDAEQLRSLQTHQRELTSEYDRLIGSSETFLAACDQAHSGSVELPVLSTLAAQLVDLAAVTARQSDAVRAEAEGIRLTLEAALSRLGPSDMDRLHRLQVAQSLVSETDAVRKSWRVAQLQTALGTLTERLEKAEKRLMGAALKRLSDDIARYYETLSPGHNIKITGVTVRDTRHRQAALSASSFDRPINPVTSFSEAQGNCLGLCLYFSQRVDRNQTWRTIMLDDPVQSMDQGHEQGLLQLLSDLSPDRQVIVMTHSRPFAQAFETQFGALDSYVRYNLYHGSDPHPKVALDRGRLNELMTFAELNVTGDPTMRESCAATLRKGVECFIREVSAKKDAPMLKRGSLEDKIDWARDRGLIEPLDAGTLHRIRDFSNPSAHDDPEGNSARGSIVANLRSLRDLQAKYLAMPTTLRLISGGYPATNGQDRSRR